MRFICDSKIAPARNIVDGDRHQTDFFRINIMHLADIPRRLYRNPQHI